MNRRLLVCIVITLSILNLARSSSVSANPFGWFDANINITLKDEGVQVYPQADYWGMYCTKTGSHKFYYKYYGGVSDHTVSDNCAYYADYGYYSSSYGLLLAGTDTSYKVFNHNSPTPVDFIVPIPQSNNAVIFNNYMSVYEDLPGNIIPEYQLTGRLNNYKLTNDPNSTERQVKYADGTRLQQIQRNSLSFSGDGKFLATNIGYHQVIVNLKTKQARRFGYNSIPDGRSTSDLSTSLNSDGSVALVNHNVFTTRLELYNLNSCTPGPNNIEDCQKRELYEYVKQRITGLQKVLSARFVTDESIELYVNVVNEGVGVETKKYILNIPGSHYFQYLGMGDSFASGEGAYDYKQNTDIDGNMCHLSKNSYPYLIKTILDYRDSESVACSGAQIKDIFVSNKDDVYEDDSPQSKGLVGKQYDTEIFTNFLPGYRRQQDFVEKYKPDAITISIGGNNINFGKKLLYCILNQYSCYEDAGNKQKILAEIKAQIEPLSATYKSLKQKSPSSRIYVIGYPELVKPGGDCANNVRLSGDELTLAQNIVHDLNQAIKLSAKKAGVVYVDATKAFDGKRLCEADSKQLAINGVTAGNDKLMVIGNETYHPNKLGHQLYKDVILSQTNNLQTVMPEADGSVDSNSLDSLLIPTGTQVDDSIGRPILEDGLFGDIMKVGSTITKTLTTNNYFFKPGSQFRVEVHSTPQEIGTATATSINTIDINTVLPDNLAPGLHAVHILGNDINGQPIDIYKDFFVIASEADYDGDGILNSSDNCTFISPINVDYDKDGIDDGCDPEISEPPADPPSNPTPDPTPSPEPPKTTPSPKILKIKKAIVSIIKAFFSFFIHLFR